MSQLLWVLLALVGLAVLLRFVAWLVQVPVAARLFGEMPWLPSEWCGPLSDGEPIEFSARDGVLLRGSYLPASNGRSKGVIVFCHELNGDRWTGVPYTKELRNRGFDVFTFDFRNHGSSQRVSGYEPMPWVTSHEVADVQGAVDYVAARRPDEAKRIGVMGIGRGGTAGLCVAATDPRISSLLVDGVIPLERLQVYAAERFVRDTLRMGWLLPALPTRVLGLLGGLAKAIIGWRCRCQVWNVEQAAARVRQPVLFVHGRHDGYVPLEVIRGLRGSMSDRTWLWVVPHARHGRAIAVAPELYARRAGYFFVHYLTAATHIDPSHDPAAEPLGKRVAGNGVMPGSSSEPALVMARFAPQPPN